MNKKKIMIIISSIILVLAALFTTTYSLFYKEDAAANPSNYSTGLLQIEATSLSDTISLDSALPMTDEEGIETTPYVFSIKNTGNVDYKFDVKLLSTSSNTINSQYIKLKIDNGNPVVLSSLTNSIIKSNVVVKAKESINITLRVWLSKDTPNTEIGKTFNSQIVIDGQSIYTSTNNDPALDTLTNLGLSVDTEHTPDFTTVSGNSGTKIDANNGNTLATGVGDNTNGIYKSEDDLGNSYYFRGNVTNNYVYFAKNWWQIIRINGDGTIRMIYKNMNEFMLTSNTNDKIVAVPLVSSTSSGIEDSAYNSDYNDNTYVGYMYGTPDSSTYNATHANTNSSTIKTVIDTWYQNNLSSYSKYIADAIYCNDREVVQVNNVGGMTLTGNGAGTNESAYAGVNRTYVDHAPTLKCKNKNDRFTTSSTLGNGALTNPIALITSDEVVMGGGAGFDLATNTYITNDNYYLQPRNEYWTMTPSAYVGGNASVNFVYDDGVVNNRSVYNNYAVRPVVSLKSDAISGGNGTSSNPFYVDEKPQIDVEPA